MWERGTYCGDWAGGAVFRFLERISQEQVLVGEGVATRGSPPHSFSPGGCLGVVVMGESGEMPVVFWLQLEAEVENLKLCELLEALPGPSSQLPRPHSPGLSMGQRMKLVARRHPES